ncbi:MAG: prolyl oligopeptidase family serine peptidase, partial [Prevotellaceae bacterium]|nr:prolyl oligopeptidase family serine peptidase [Prevotellaceae bacterium]
MKPVNLLVMSALMTLMACGNAKQDTTNDTAAAPLIERSDIQLPGRRLTPEGLWAMGRIGGVSISPDEKQMAYTVAYYSVAQDKSNREVFVMNTDGTDGRQITHTSFGENEVTWIKGGTRLAFLSTESGSSQLWDMNPDGTDRRQLTRYDGDLEAFAFSPDETKLLFVAAVPTKQSTAQKYPDLPQATGIIVTDLMYKHWDEWVTTAPHPFVADLTADGLSGITDLLAGEPYESPMRPFGGIEQLAWSPDGKHIAYTCRKKTGLQYAVSTNSDIYVYDLDTKQTTNITEENKGYDTNPAYSPDGRYIAWQSMERDGYEADQNRLFVMDLATGKKTFVSAAFPSNVDSYIWNKASDGFYFIGVWHGETHIYSVSLSGQLTQVTDGVYDYASLALADGKIIAKRHSMSEGDEIYAVTSRDDIRQLTFENKHIYDQIERGRVEARWMKTTDGKQMLTWVIYPPQFDPKKKYPTLLFCEGGPQSPVSQFWSYRWNFQIMAANDYIIVAPNRRGLPGFGLEWNEAISGDYGGQCMRDYFTAIDEMAKEPFVDNDRLGCVGASFGGFSVYWIAGHHDHRFKAFISHDGIF